MIGGGSRAGGEVEHIRGLLRLLLAERDGPGVGVGLAAAGGGLLRLDDQVDRLDELVEVRRQRLVAGLGRDRQPGELADASPWPDRPPAPRGGACE